ncbi:WhiB family transcriptional regulator [Streptomyces anulatus]|uniref:WhiB family transcriptional regulator n=1 Tax=Streptomyces anulatus TaxID=1892 RepID=UPI00340C2C1A
MSTTLFKVTRSHTAPDTLGPAGDWRTLGTCSSAPDDELWFPEPGNWRAIHEAIRTCVSCPVLLLCRQAAADEERGLGKAARYGIRGGHTTAQRWAADPVTRSAQGKSGRQLAPCGTPAAYDRHTRRGETACDPCRLAHNKRTAEAKARSRHRQPASTECGTRGGYQKHRRNGEPACDPCRAANSDADRRLRNTGTTTERSAA